MNFPDLTKGDWSLFLDRDGVLNKKIDYGYVTKVSEFEFLPGVLSAVAILSKIFKRIIVVTNQRGIFKGLYTTDTLSLIHNYLLNEIIFHGGRIDKIYFCPHDYSDLCNCRKPGIGMPLMAKAEFDDIDFNKSIIIGDSISDIQMGQKLDMITVLISEMEMKNINSHFRFSTLFNFSTLVNFNH
jgi:D-glycero-D-manno-heptose 1,7-bisphosphate phosphatase